MEPCSVGGLGVLDPNLLLHDLRASTLVLARNGQLSQGARSISTPAGSTTASSPWPKRERDEGT